MITFLFAFGVLALVMLGMAVGVILQNKPIKGSCGGMASLGIDTSCDICGGDTSKCEEEQLRLGNDALTANINEDSTVKDNVKNTVNGNVSVNARDIAYDASKKS